MRIRVHIQQGPSAVGSGVTGSRSQSFRVQGVEFIV